MYTYKGNALAISLPVAYPKLQFALKHFQIQINKQYTGFIMQVTPRIRHPSGANQAVSNLVKVF